MLCNPGTGGRYGKNTIRARRLAPILGLGLLLASAPELASAQDGASPAAGLAYAEANCQQCHAIGIGLTRSSDARAPAFQVLANTSGMTALTLQVALTTAHRNMPNFVLPDENRDEVIAYVLSLKTPKPAP